MTCRLGEAQALVPAFWVIPNNAPEVYQVLPVLRTGLLGITSFHPTYDSHQSHLGALPPGKAEGHEKMKCLNYPSKLISLIRW